MNIILWVVFGMLIGVVTNWLNPKRSVTDLMGSLVLGVIGALLGGMLANVLLGVTMVGFNLVAFIVALLGAVILLGVNNSLRHSY